MKKALGVIFIATVFGMFALGLMLPNKPFSDNENRVLAQSPELTAESLMSGEFATEFEEYLADQFPGRDMFVTVKAAAELATGKAENNGVYLAGDRLINKLDEVDYTRLDRNIGHVNRFAQATDARVYLMLVPDAQGALHSLLPEGAPAVDQRELLNYIYERISDDVTVVDLYGALENKPEYYYRTDHHWTAEGCYAAYVELTKAMGKEPVTPDNVRLLTDSFYGTTWSKSGARWVGPDPMYAYDFAGSEGAVVTVFDDGSVTSMYDESWLDEKDKYSVYLGGNRAFVSVTEMAGEGSTLFIKDSFGNAFIPVYAHQAEEVYAADLRFYRAPMSGVVAERGVDSVVLLYGLSSFCADANLGFLA